MNITDSTLKLNITSNNNLKVSTPNTSVGGTVTANAQISLAKEGQIFNGKILDITNNKVSIMLDNNKTLFAQMEDAISMNIGDSLTFMIKENNGNNVLIKPYGNGIQNMKDNAIFKILDANSITLTDKNYQIAEGLMNNNMPVDKASMHKIMQQSYKFPDASVDTIINLNKVGIPVNETNINQYEAYMNNTHQLSNDIVNLSNSIIDFNKETVNNILNQMGMTEDMAGKQLNIFNSSLLSTLSDDIDSANIDIKQLINNGIEFSDANNIEELDNSLILKDATNQSNVILSEAVNQSIDLPMEGNALSQNLQDVVLAKIDLLSNKLDVNMNDLQGLVKELNGIGVSDNIINNIIDNSKTPLQILNNVNELLNNSEILNISPDSMKDLLNSDSYNNLLAEAIKDKFSIKPKDMENPKELDDLYKNIYEKTSKLIDAFSANSNQSAGESMSQSARNMQQRIDFMQNLNNMFAYAQIPVKLDQNQMNSDLYVYMNKRNMKSSKEEVSALLHLDMDHLGATDVHVSLHGNNVHTRFYVEDEMSAKIIDEHMSMLEQAIKENGFNLTNEVITREPALAIEPNMAIKEMLNIDLEKSVKRYSFDMRT